jgi:hypothetical protein
MSFQENNDYLMQALGFTPQELMMNRGGIISQEQKARLQAKLGQQRQVGMKIVAIVIVITLVVGAGLLVFNPEITRNLKAAFDTNPLIFVIPVAALVLWLLMIGAGFARSGRASFENARLLAVSGQPKLKIGGAYPYSTAGLVMTAAGQDTQSYLVQMGKLKFYVDAATYQGFAEGHPYCLYYIPYGRVPLLISAEALPA